MLTLLLFSFLAGVVTVFSPCVLPVLPALLGAGFIEGRQRAYGVIVGFVASFTAATLLLSQALQTAGIAGSWPLALAVALLALFGLGMLFPRVGDFLTRWMHPFAALGQQLASQAPPHGDFWGGLLLGMALGLIWTPCAGPILATIIILAALQAVTFKTVAMTLAYAVGTALPMLLILRGGGFLQRLTAHRRFLSQGLRRLFGLLTLTIALALALQWDKPFQAWVAQHLPPIGVENNRLVQRKLSALVKEASGNTFVLRPSDVAFSSDGTLPVLAPAPELQQLSGWINSPPLTLESLKGKVVLVDFWTYSCINCLRTLPHLIRWYQNYSDKGFVLLGIHTPEFPFEKEYANVEAAVRRYGIPYPIALDNDYATWRAYGNLYWPAHYLIDRDGKLRYYHFGEGNYMETENAIRSLLDLPPITGVTEAEKHRFVTPEIYLGYARASHYGVEATIARDKTELYHMLSNPHADEVSLEGPWEVTEQAAVARGDDSHLILDFMAARVFLVLSGESSQPVTVTLDGRPLTPSLLTADTNARGEITVQGPRKYDIVDVSGRYGRHILRLHVPKGIAVYAFTFGDQ